MLLLLPSSLPRSLSGHGAAVVGALAVVELLEQVQDLRLAHSELLHPDDQSSHRLKSLPPTLQVQLTAILHDVLPRSYIVQQGEASSLNLK